MKTDWRAMVRIPTTNASLFYMCIVQTLRNNNCAKPQTLPLRRLAPESNVSSGLSATISGKIPARFIRDYTRDCFFYPEPAARQPD
ncbi:hypothetical protein IBT47_04270 [Erwinia sp. S43]|uniref:hypothetical protein n=1 Tax=Erwinia sp. S43 TaxID=2769339 RepID=UPI00190951DE|nr:hypothetical protein [Erwinia sp. S43]MBK0031494.1 hypothetical protein [Erwinia sp. S43]